MEMYKWKDKLQYAAYMQNVCRIIYKYNLSMHYYASSARLSKAARTLMNITDNDQYYA